MGKRRTAHPSESRIRDGLHAAFPDAEVDLHGLRREQALVRVDQVLDTWARRGGHPVVRIITGRGNRSAGDAVLLSAVEEHLRGEVGDRVAEMARDPGGGAWLVRIA
ncbi:MAG: hypothetical protein HKN72_06400 [Gemmatimonadetes bacterium]|nr:Smr/MutS family protein [Gemmatimonadota bacterium]NNF12831.1 hypothetical protein [Gemmatimonadota bacterium]NNL30026.1 hypothetical protein [Gemmatimonadota bacterium]